MISYLLFVYQLCYNILVLLNKQYPTRKNPFSARSENSAILSGPGQKILLSFQSTIRKFRSFSGPAQKIPPSVCELSWSVPKFAATPATDPSSLKWTLQKYVQYSIKKLTLNLSFCTCQKMEPEPTQKKLAPAPAPAQAQILNLLRLHPQKPRIRPAPAPQHWLFEWSMGGVLQFAFMTNQVLVPGLNP